MEQQLTFTEAKHRPPRYYQLSLQRKVSHIQVPEFRRRSVSNLDNKLDGHYTMGKLHSVTEVTNLRPEPRNQLNDSKQEIEKRLQSQLGAKVRENLSQWMAQRKAPGFGIKYLNANHLLCDPRQSKHLTSPVGIHTVGQQVEPVS